MISLLNELETRRKIVFATDCLTIRSIGTKALLIIIDRHSIPGQALMHAQAFLQTSCQAAAVDSIIVDISRGDFRTIVEALTFQRTSGCVFARYAILTRKVSAHLLLPLLLFISRSRVRLFGDLASAVAWIK